MTREFKTINTRREYFISITCDSCGDTFTPTYMEDDECGKFVHIEKEYPGSSIFGEDAYVMGDLCQLCVKELLGQILFINGRKGASK